RAVVAARASDRHEAPQAGLLACVQRTIVAGQEAIERGRRDQRRLIRLQGAAVVGGGEPVILERTPEPGRIIQLREPGERRLFGSEAQRSGERAFGLVGAGLAIAEPAYRRLRHPVENRWGVARSERAACIGRERPAVGAPVAGEMATR